MHGGSSLFYLYAFASLMGLPALLLLGPGVVLGARKALARSAPHLLNLALLGGVLVFFGLLYDFNAKRFLVYAAFPAALLIAEALARLPAWTSMAAAVLLVAGAALPLPGLGNPPTTRRSTCSSASPTAAGATGRSPVSRTPCSSRRSSCRPPPSRGGDWSHLGISEVGFQTRDYAVFRARLPETDGAWLLVAPGGSGVERLLRARARVAPLPVPDPEAWRQGRRRAEEILGYLQGSDTYLAIAEGGADPGPSRLYLPFLCDSPEVIVNEPGRGPELLRFLADAPVLDERRFGPAGVRKIRLFGQDSGLVSYLPWPTHRR